SQREGGRGRSHPKLLRSSALQIQSQKRDWPPICRNWLRGMPLLTKLFHQIGTRAAVMPVTILIGQDASNRRHAYLNSRAGLGQPRNNPRHNSTLETGGVKERGDGGCAD